MAKKSNKLSITDPLTNLTRIRQPNKVTMAHHNYSQTENRILLRVIEALQEPMNQLDGLVKQDKKNKEVLFQQLPLFTNEKTIELELAFNKLCPVKQNYSEVKTALEHLRNVGVTIESQDEYVITGLFNDVYFPRPTHNRSVKISINKKVVEYLMDIRKGFTSFSLEVAYDTNNKYTARIYQLICKWKDVPVYRMKYDEFREWLGITDKYDRFDNLNSRVLKPAYLELKEKSDVYFEYSVTKDNNVITHINFVPKIRKTLKLETDQLETIKQRIAETYVIPFELSLQQQNSLYEMITTANATSVFSKLADLDHVFMKNIAGPEKERIKNKGNYALKSIAEFLNTL